MATARRSRRPSLRHEARWRGLAQPQPPRAQVVSAAPHHQHYSMERTSLLSRSRTRRQTALPKSSFKRSTCCWAFAVTKLGNTQGMLDRGQAVHAQPDPCHRHKYESSRQDTMHHYRAYLCWQGRAHSRNKQRLSSGHGHTNRHAPLCSHAHPTRSHPVLDLLAGLLARTFRSASTAKFTASCG